MKRPAAEQAAASDRKEAMVVKLSSLCDLISARTYLSTTGYQTAMGRLKNRDRPDARSETTVKRAEQYIAAAKKTFPNETLKSLAQLQQGINASEHGLVSPIKMTSAQFGVALQVCRQNKFSNCDMQALEVGLHVKHELGISNFKIYSNSALSHNYVVIDPCEQFPKGIAVDPWTGQGVREMTVMNKFKLKHNENNCKVNQNMMDFIDKHGAGFVNTA